MCGCSSGMIVLIVDQNVKKVILYFNFRTAVSNLVKSLWETILMNLLEYMCY